jgi:hypothetical protein
MSSTFGSPNFNDPLFINLRIKSNDPTIYDNIAISINAAFTDSERLFQGQVNHDTPISELLGKVIIILDNNAIVDNNTQNLANLNELININSATTDFPSTTYSTLETMKTTSVNLKNIKNCLLCTDIEDVQTAIPDISNSSTANPFMDDFITKHNCQIIPFKFYSMDSSLEEYEDLFNNFGTALIPFYTVIKYLKKKNNPMQNV